MNDFISVYMTSASLDEAQIIARALVEEKLAACVNILPKARSVYCWQGQVEVAEEVVLIAKSRASLFTQLEMRVKSLNSYDCPCIVAMPITAGHQPYLDWIKQETR